VVMSRFWLQNKKTYTFLNILISLHLSPYFFLRVTLSWFITSVQQRSTDEIFLNTYCQWLYFFTVGVETELEEKLLGEQLMIWIGNCTNISDPLKKYCEDCFRDFFGDLLYYCNRHFFHIWSGDVRVNSFVESENKILDLYETGPKPTMRIDRSVESVMKLDGTRRRKRSMEKWRKFHCSLPTRDIHSTEANDEFYDVKQALSVKILKKPLHEGWSQFQKRVQYIVLEVPASFVTDKFHLNLNGGQMHIDRAFWVTTDPNNNWECHPVIPSIRRTRCVILYTYYLDDNPPHTYFHCDCLTVARKGYCCRHMYSVLERPPTSDDFNFFCFKQYDLNYGTNDAVTAATHQICSIGPSSDAIHIDDGDLSAKSEFTQYEDLNDVHMLNWFVKGADWDVVTTFPNSAWHTEGASSRSLAVHEEVNVSSQREDNDMEVVLGEDINVASNLGSHDSDSDGDEVVFVGVKTPEDYNEHEVHLDNGSTAPSSPSPVVFDAGNTHLSKETRARLKNYDELVKVLTDPSLVPGDSNPHLSPDRGYWCAKEILDRAGETGDTVAVELPELSYTPSGTSRTQSSLDAARRTLRTHDNELWNVARTNNEVDYLIRNRLREKHILSMKQARDDLARRHSEIRQQRGGTALPPPRLSSPVRARKKSRLEPQRGNSGKKQRKLF
jgi:hypothetical protein